MEERITKKMCNDKICELKNKYKNTKNKVRQLMFNNEKIIEKRNGLGGGIIYGALTVLSANIAFMLGMINPTSLPFIIVGCCLALGGSSIIGLSISKRKKHELNIDKNNAIINDLNNEIDNIKYELSKYNEKLHILSTEEKSTYKPLKQNVVKKIDNKIINNSFELTK